MQMSRLTEARRAKGWSQMELAERLGIAQQTIQRYEAGSRDVKASTIVRLCETLGVTASYLLGIEDGNEDATIEVPVVGPVAAGNPLEMEESHRNYAVPATVRKRWPNAFLLRVEGSSMDRVLPDGCYALVDPCDDVDHDGQPYAVRVGDLAATVKRVRRVGGSYELAPDSHDPSFQPIILGDEELSVIGRVVWHCIPYDWSY